MATPSSDIYSLAVVAYEMLTGRLPFESDSAVGVAMKHINEQPRHPSLINPTVPRQAGDIVMRALAKDPTRRFATAGAFAQALNEWRTYDPHGRPPPTASPIWLPHNQRTGQEVVTPIDEPPPGERPIPRLPPPAVPRRTATVAAPAVSAGPPEPLLEERGANLGCASWIVGAGVILGLAALVWFGARLSDRLGGFGSGNRSNRTSTAQAVAVLPTSTPRIRGTPTVTAAIVAAAPTATIPAQSVVVPDLAGMTQAQAVAALDAIGLVLDVGGTKTSDTIDAGRVVAQQPPPNAKTDLGSSVTVNLSAGPAVIDLTKLDLIGKDPDADEETLRSRGLEVGRRDVGSPTIAAGLVAATDPANSAQVGDSVTLLVSVGNKIQIPRDIQGAPVAEAAARLTQLGLTVANKIGVSATTIKGAGILDLQAAGIKDGDVVGIQDSGATFGGFVDPGASVTLVYYDARLPN